MRNFLRTATYFAIFIIIIAFLLQALISFRIKGKCITGMDNLDHTANVNADLVFVGSSRCMEHFDPFFFENTLKVKSVNIGIEAHSEITMAIVRLQNYLSKNKKPKFVILSFDPLSSGGSLTENTNMLNKNNFARYVFWPEKNNLLFIDYFKFNWSEKHLPLYAIFKYDLLKDCINIKNFNYIANGYEKHDEHWDTISKPITNAITKNFFTIEQIPLIKKMLNKLNTFCLINNIKFLCIQTPVYKILSNNIDFRETTKICRELNIPIIELNKSNIQNNINYFYNSNHMNKYGVEKMNEFLSKDSMFKAFLQPLK